MLDLLITRHENAVALGLDSLCGLSSLFDRPKSQGQTAERADYFTLPIREPADHVFQ